MFEDNLILIQEQTQSLFAFPKKDFFSLLKQEKVKSLWSLPDHEIKCFPLNSDKTEIEDYTETLTVSDLKEIGYVRDTWRPNIIQFRVYNS